MREKIEHFSWRFTIPGTWVILLLLALVGTIPGYGSPVVTNLIVIGIVAALFLFYTKVNELAKNNGEQQTQIDELKREWESRR